MKRLKEIIGNPKAIPEELLADVAGGAMEKPADCGRKMDQYEVHENFRYYYHYTGGGHDTWLHIYVNKIVEESKGILWFTERFAYVTYDNGMTGKLPLDTGDVYLDETFLGTLRSL